MNQTQIEDMEALVEKLDGVIAAKFITDEDGRLEEIHVLADKFKSPKQLSRDIQSALSASTGMSIEHKIISIAQIDEDTGRKAEAARLRISGLDISYSQNEFSASVALEIEGQTFKGTAKGLFTACNRLTEVAHATLEAINEYIKQHCFLLYDIQRFTIGRYPAVIVAVSYFDSGRNEKVLTGTSIIRDDEYYSVIKATLNAVNRVLAHLAAS